MKVFRLCVVALAAIAVFAAACGGAGEDALPVTNAPEPGVLRMPGPEPRTLDPALAGDVGSAFYVEEIFGGLLTWVPKEYASTDEACYDFQGRSYCLVPDIAESIPSPQFNADGTVSYTFTLRDDVKFHRGRKVTAQDFKYSLERAADPRTGSTTDELYLWDIVGARQMSRGQATSIPGVEVVNDFTLTMTIEHYNAA